MVEVTLTNAVKIDVVIQHGFFIFVQWYCLFIRVSSHAQSKIGNICTSIRAFAIFKYLHQRSPYFQDVF